MIPQLRKVTHPQTQSFSAFIEQPPAFHTPWHYHPEYELIFIQNCAGTRYMGDHIEEFGPQELVLVGPNLPHYWKATMEDPKDESNRAMVIHFSEDNLSQLTALPEAYRLNKMLQDAAQGLVFLKPPEDLLLQLISLFDKKSLTKYLSLLNLLDKLSETAYQTLSSKGFVHIINSDDTSRLNMVMRYTIENFRDKIRVDKIASMANMSKTSFCRYFKHRTGKRYYDVVKEIRIGHACRLLQQDKLDIVEVCYESGYENLSNFNKQFKSITKMAPKDYRRSFR
jgi:AraC-like DNA-binding protein